MVGGPERTASLIRGAVTLAACLRIRSFQAEFNVDAVRRERI